MYGVSSCCDARSEKISFSKSTFNFLLEGGASEGKHTGDAEAGTEAEE